VPPLQTNSTGAHAFDARGASLACEGGVTRRMERLDGSDSVREAGDAGDASTARGERADDSAARGARSEDSAARARPGDAAARGVWARASALARTEAGQLAGWVLVALALRLLMLGFESVLTPDGVMYAIFGRHFRVGNFAGGMHHYFPPLYSMLIGFAALFVEDLERAGQLVSAVSGALTVLPVYFLARDAYGRRVATLAALLAAAHPLLLHYSAVVLTEATFTFLFACALLFGRRALEGGRARLFALAGLALGACYLLKPEAAGFVPLLLVLTVVAKLCGRRLTWRGVAAGAAALLTSFLLLALPYVIYLRGRLGRWTISGKVAGHLWGYARAGNTAERPGGEVLDLVPGLTTMLVQLTKSLKQEYEFANFVIPPSFVLLAGLGLFRSRWTRGRAGRELYLLAFTLATVAGYAVTQSNVRSFVPLVPVLVVWVALGVFEAADWFGESTAGTRAGACARARGGWPLRLAISAALLLSLLPLTFYLKRGDAWADYGGQKRVGLWIKANQRNPRGSVVLATVPIVPFYSVGDFRKLETYQTYAGMIEQARAGRADYVVINERDFRGRPLGFLLDESAQTPPGLRLAHKYRDPSGLRVFLYEVAGQ
jgi:4-amino-4-deoxy-L-arabinose transferase-like glycosyltransferase